MMESCHFSAKDQVYAFCDFLQTRSEFTPLVQSLFVCPIGFPPYPLIRMLPNVSTLRFIICRFGESRSACGASPSIDPQLLTDSGVDEVVTSLLLDGARCTVQTLMWTGRLDVIPPAFLMPSEWKRLHTLTIQSELGRGAADDIEKLLTKFCPPSLEDLNNSSVAAVGHDDNVLVIVVSPHSKWIASGSEDSTIIVWDSGGQLCDEWVAHHGDVYSLAFSLDSRFLASGGRDSKIIVWDVNQDARRVATLEGYTGDVRRCAWSPDGTTIISVDSDRTVRLWDTKTFQQFHLCDGRHEGPILFIHLSPDGRWLASGGEDYHCCIWDVASGTLHKVLRGHTQLLSGAAFDPVSTRLATASCDHTVRIWDVETAKPIFVLQQHTGGVRYV
ncbi:WD40-repeat-containing domain protein [Dichomitus squalens]|uniref:WD40-repeat-containing domain protein n=1 Tax=Dichomitus squalens TaxID=114155 RepID=A0A4Q9PK02_9APHY|nr:WD40-repeat-containing domain protein [Dichomitus squalens]